MDGDGENVGGLSFMAKCDELFISKITVCHNCLQSFVHQRPSCIINHL